MISGLYKLLFTGEGLLPSGWQLKGEIFCERWFCSRRPNGASDGMKTAAVQSLVIKIIHYQ